MEKRRRVSVIIATIVLVMFILLLGIIVLYSSYTGRNKINTTDVEDGVDMLIASTVATPTKGDTSKTFDLSNLKEADNYLYVGFTSDHRLELNLNLEGNGSWQTKDNELIYTYDESSMTLTVTDDVEIVAGVDGAKLVVRYIPAVTRLNSSMGTEKEFTNADMTAIIKSISVKGNSLDALSVTVSMNREGTKQVSEIDYSSIKQDMVSLITENNIKVVHFTFEDLLTDGIESETLDTNSNVKYYITGDELVVFTDTLHFISAPTNSSELFSGESWQNVEFFKFNNFYTNKVNNTTSMFGGLNNLKAIFVNKKTMKLNKVSSSTNMFLGCINLVGYYGTGESDKFAFDSALPVDKTYAKIASSEGGYFTQIPAQNVILGDSDWTGWTYGENVNTPFTARFGTIEITYYDENENVVEDIALADAGSYSLVARVEGTSTYTAASLVKQFVISPMNVNVDWYEPTENCFVYNKEGENRHKVMRYNRMFPIEKMFTWKDVKRTPKGHYLLMHSAIYRTQLLRECGLKLPEHTFYVDNIYVFNPLPFVKNMYYLDVNFYSYYIGRGDQSVNQDIMISRIDQQIKVNKLMIDYYVENLGMIRSSRERYKYMFNYLEIITAITSILAIASGTEENLAKRVELLEYIKSKSFLLYMKIRYSIEGTYIYLPGKGGRKITLAGYKILRRIYNFN